MEEDPLTTGTAAEQVYWDDVKEWQEIPSLKKNATSQQLVQWAAASGDFYQIHYDQDFARGNGLKGIIIHGALKHAFLGQLLHERVGYQGSIKRYAVSYRGMDVPGEEMTCRGVVTKTYVEDGKGHVDLDIWAENPQGQKTTPGTATVILPRRAG
jgi:acyl dehydratase